MAHFDYSKGKGKGGKGLGKGGAKRHRKLVRDNVAGITKPAIRRLARRGERGRVAGQRRDGGSLARQLLEEPVVLWRAAEGTAVAFEDRCCHRHAPLSVGKVTKTGLQCGYHGLTIDPDGNCVDVPSQDRVPPDARVRRYPTVERNDCCLLYTSPSPRDGLLSRMASSA